MSTNNEFTSPVAALMLPVLNKPLLTYSRAVHKALQNNPAFPSPNPPLSVFAANIEAFEAAETEAATRAKGAASFRDTKKKPMVQIAPDQSATMIVRTTFDLVCPRTRRVRSRPTPT